MPVDVMCLKVLLVLWRRARHFATIIFLYGLTAERETTVLIVVHDTERLLFATKINALEIQKLNSICFFSGNDAKLPSCQTRVYLELTGMYSSYLSASFRGIFHSTIQKKDNEISSPISYGIICRDISSMNES